MKNTRSARGREMRIPIGNIEWASLDAGTTGLAVPVYVLELAAQWIQAWGTVEYENSCFDLDRSLVNFGYGMAQRRFLDQR